MRKDALESSSAALSMHRYGTPAGPDVGLCHFIGQYQCLWSLHNPEAGQPSSVYSTFLQRCVAQCKGSPSPFRHHERVQEYASQPLSKPEPDCSGIVKSYVYVLTSLVKFWPR